MEIQGRIYKVLPTRTGKKADGSEWRSQEFIVEFFETADQRWSDKVVLNIMNDRINEYQLREGDEVHVGFSHGVREYQGKYYPEFRIYKFEKVSAKSEPQATAAATKTTAPQTQPTAAQAMAAQGPFPPQQPAQGGQEHDDLPF